MKPQQLPKDQAAAHLEDLPQKISPLALYALTGYKRGTIHQLIVKGIVPPSVGGWFDTIPTLQAIFLYGRGYKGGDKTARDRKLEADAALSEMKVGMMAGRLINRASVERAWSRACADVSARAMMMPSRLGVCFGVWPDRHAFEAAIEDEVRQTLTSMSQEIEYGTPEPDMFDGDDDDDNDEQDPEEAGETEESTDGDGGGGED